MKQLLFLIELAMTRASAAIARANIIHSFVAQERLYVYPEFQYQCPDYISTYQLIKTNTKNYLL